MTQKRLVVLLASVMLAGCETSAEGDPPHGGAVSPEVSVALVPGDVWVTILERDMRGKRSLPEPFRGTADSLRVITSMGPSTSPYVLGLVITNLLSDSTALPVASIRAAQRHLGVEMTDTTVVEVPRGQLYFFVPEHRGLEDWRVSIQERRSSPD